MARQHSTRISAGLFRYRVIQQPGSQTRPVTQKVRAAIFNTLGQDLSDCQVLDAFAGSGALGFEALSRGAANVLFVDKDSLAISTIRANIEHLGVADKADILQRDWSSFASTQTRQFNIVFLDPPYADFQTEMVVQAEKFLLGEGILILSSSDRAEVPETIASLERIKEKQYGNTKISYFRRK